MRFSQASLLAACVPAVAARFFEPGDADAASFADSSDNELCLIETAPGQTSWVRESEKWELRRNGIRFMDITATQELGTLHASTQDEVTFPDKMVKQDEVEPLLKTLSKDEMQANLEKLSSFHTRYYKSSYGLESSDWILQKVDEIIKDAGAEETVSVQSFPHTWQQHSVIATIPGRTNTTIVIGAHQDSINLWLPAILAAPGADDDGSGSVTIMETFRALLNSEDIVDGKAINTVEFHWYSAEEGGLLGSQAIFQSYEEGERDVKAMLHQDMTGYVQKTLDEGNPESIGIIMDFVDLGLTKFVKLVIEEYCNLPWVETLCGYSCSDHSSASKAGYPSACATESEFKNMDPHIHGVDDTIKYLSFDHMVEHARMAVGLVYELAHHDFYPSDEEVVKSPYGSHDSVADEAAEWTDL